LTVLSSPLPAQAAVETNAAVAMISMRRCAQRGGDRLAWAGVRICEIIIIPWMS